MSRYRPTTDYLGFARRTVRGAGRCVASRGLEGPDDLRDLADLAVVANEAVTVAVAGLRAQGCSWQVIADSLGVTRQAAWERFRSVDTRTGDGGHSPDLLRVGG